MNKMKSFLGRFLPILLIVSFLGGALLSNSIGAQEMEAKEYSLESNLDESGTLTNQDTSLGGELDRQEESDGNSINKEITPPVTTQSAESININTDKNKTIDSSNKNTEEESNKAEYKKTFTFEDDEVIVVANVKKDAGISEDAVLKADVLKGKELSEAYNKAKEYLKVKDNEELVYYPLDIYFQVGNKKIEPLSCLVEISITYKNVDLNIFANKDKEILREAGIIHIKEDGQVEQLKDLTSSDNSNDKCDTKFKVSSFSPMGEAAIARASGRAGEIFAMLYSNGDFVIQAGDAVDNSRGTVVKQYEDFIDKEEASPWDGDSDVVRCKKVVIKDSISPISTQKWFKGFFLLTEIEGLDKIKGDRLKDARDMFNGASRLKELDLASLDVSKLEDASSMFYNTTSLEKLNVSNWNTASLTKTSYMFYSTSSLDEIDVSHFKMDKVTSITNMFKQTGARKINVSNWKLANMYISSIFAACPNLEEVNTNGWLVDPSASVSSIFDGSSKVKDIDLSWFKNTEENQLTSALRGTNPLRLTLPALPLSSLQRMQLGDFKWYQRSDGDTLTTAELIDKHLANKKLESYDRIIDITFEELNPNKKKVYSFVAYNTYYEDDIAIPVKENYIFDGWYTKEFGGEKLIDGKSKYTQEKYYAHWKAKTYNLILKSNNTKSEEKKISLAYDDKYLVSTTIFSNPGYTLSGWNTEPNGTGTSYPASGNLTRLTNKSEITLYAQWIKNDEYVTLSFDPGNGTKMADITIPKNSRPPYATIPAPYKVGYKFDNWYTVINGKEISISGIQNAFQDFHFVAKYNKNPVIIFRSMISSTYDITREVFYGDNIYDLPTFRENANKYMSFMGWYTEPDGGGTKVDYLKAIKEDAQYYALWGYKPSVHTGGGTITNNVSYPLQKDPKYKIDFLPEVERQGYIFDGWYRGGAENDKINIGDTIDLSKGIYIVARWKKDYYTVTLHTEVPGENLKIDYPSATKLNIDKGAELTGLYTPTLSISNTPLPYKYFFKNWQDKNGKVYKNGDIVNGDIDLYANWFKGNHYKITFDNGDGTKDYSYVYSGNRILKVGKEKKGYIFQGWFDSPDGKGEKLTEKTLVTGDTTFYAYYTPALVEYKSGPVSGEFIAEWMNTSTGFALNEADTLNYTIDTEAIGTTTNAALHLRLDLKGNQDTVPIGAAKITVPKYIWKDWDGNDVGSCDISVAIPKWPEKREGQLFSYMETDDSYIFINNSELSNGSGLDVVMNYSVDPRLVPGGARDELYNPIEGYPYYKGTVPVHFTVDTDGDGKSNMNYSKDLYVEMHSGLKFQGAYSKDQPTISYTWPGSANDKPIDADDYFYITWKVGPAVNNVSQPYTYYWTGDLAQEGEIVELDSRGVYKDKKTEDTDYTYFTVKYPKSLLDNIPPEGIKLTANAVLNIDWKSGYQEKSAINLVYNLMSADYPDGVFEKYNQNMDGYNKDNAVEIKDGQNTLADDKKEVSMPWYLTFSGRAYNKDPQWDDVNNKYIVDKSTFELVDGRPGDVMYNSGKTSSKYTWEPESGNIALYDDDYYIKSINIYIKEYNSTKVGNIWTEKVADYGDRMKKASVKVYVRYANTDEFVYLTNAYPNQTLTLPENVAGYKVLYDTDYFYTEFVVRGYFYIKPTNHILGLMKEDIELGNSSIFKNQSTCKIWQTDNPNKIIYNATNNYGGMNPANRVIYDLQSVKHSLNISKYADYESKVIFDNVKGIQDNIISIKAFNQSDAGDNRKIPIKAGVFYDLLPRGTTVSPDTICMRFIDKTSDWQKPYDSIAGYTNILKNNKNNEKYYDVKFVDNWEGSSRTMMIINYTGPHNASHIGVEFLYKLRNTYDNIVENGNLVTNSVAFVEKNGGILPSEVSNRLDKESEQYFKGIAQEDPDRTGYASCSVPYRFVSAYSWGFNKYVKARSATYNQEDVTMPGDKYSYKLSYSQSEEKESTRILFMDILEAGVQKDINGVSTDLRSGWHGTFDSIDVSAMEKILSADTNSPCNPVVYYSTKDRETLKKSSLYTVITGNDDDDKNIFGDLRFYPDDWTTVMPADKSKITAICIDCSRSKDGGKFIFKSEKPLTAIVTMKAPDDKNAYDKKAYNEAITSACMDETLKIPDFITLRSDTQVTLRDVEPELHKSSDPETGTATNPREVKYQSDLVYRLKINNIDKELTINDIILEDPIPKGLIVDTANIKVTFGSEDEAVKVSESARVEHIIDPNDNNNLKFKIGALKPGESVIFIIPTTVNITDGVLINQARITRINDNERDIKSEITYHKVIPSFDLVVKKTVSGDAAEKDKAFNFTLRLTQEGEYPIPKELEYILTTATGETKGTIQINNGLFKFQLKADESIKFLDIPRSTSYEVVETDGKAQGYRVTSDNASGLVPRKGTTTGKELVEVKFNNHKDMPMSLPNTGSRQWLILLVSLIASGSAAVWFRSRKNKVQDD